MGSKEPSSSLTIRFGIRHHVDGAPSHISMTPPDLISWHHYTPLLYHLYIDESGDLGDYLDESYRVIRGSSGFFTLAGIIVSDDEKERLDGAIRLAIDRYFSSIPLPERFKLHYHPLRNKRDPYDKLSDTQRKTLADDVFDMIRRSDCALLSVTIDLKRHRKKYLIPADPQSYAMLIMLERFQDFLEENGGVGEAVYERFNKRARKRAERTMTGLREVLRFRHYRELSNISGHIRNGDPKTQPILQLADFFAYATRIRSTTDKKSEERWQSIKGKYFRLDHGWYKAGNVEI